MFNKEEVQLLQGMKGTAMISIISPIDHSFKSDEINGNALQKLIDSTKTKLNGNYDPDRSKKLLSRLSILEKEIDFTKSMKGIALFVSEGYSKIFSLPFVPAAKMTIGSSFETRDLLLGLNKSPEYLLLDLNMGTVHFYRGKDEELLEVKDKFFPVSHRPIERSEPVNAFEHVDHEVLEDMKIFLRNIGEQLYHIVQADKTPLFAAGEDKYLSFFKEHTQAGKYMKAGLPYSLHDLTPDQIVKKVQPDIEKYAEKIKLLLIAEFEEARGKNLVAKGLQKVWKAVKLGQVKTLLVEENYKQSGRTMTGDEFELSLEDDPMGRLANWHDDLVDDIIELVSQKDGEVVFYKDNQLTDLEKLGAILRYAV
jgi:hypothetical protein